MGTTAGIPATGALKKDESPPSGETPKSTSPATPATPGAAAPPTSGESVVTTAPVTGTGVPKEEIERFERMIGDQQSITRALHQQNIELTRRLQEATAAAPAAPAADQDKAFWERPAETIRKMIADEMEARVRPLNAKIESTMIDRRFDAVKQEYADIWDDIEGELKQTVETAKAQGHNVDEQLIRVLALATTGAYYRGQLVRKPHAPPAPTAAPVAAAPAPVVDPAFLRPSAPAAPRPDAGNGAAKREFTEVERRLMRERNISEEKWIALMDASPTDFMNVALPKKEGAK